MKKYWEEYLKFKEFVGSQVLRGLLWMVVVGIAWFAIETVFVLVLQIFFKAFGLIQDTQVDKLISRPFTLLEAVLIIVVFGVVRALCQSYNVYYSTAVGQIFLKQQRERILRVSILDLKNLNTAKSLDAFNERALMASRTLEYMAQAIMGVVTVAMLLGFGFYYAPLEMFGGVFILTIFVYPLGLLNKTLRRIADQLIKKSETINALLIESIRNALFINLTNTEKQQIVRGRNNLQQYYENFQRYALIAGIRSSAPLMVGTLSVGIIAYYSRAKLNTSPIQLVSFFYIFVRLAQNLSTTVNTWTNLRLYYPSLQKLYSWQKLDKNESVPEGPMPTAWEGEDPLQIHSIQAQNLSFKYEQEKIFENLNVQVQKGDFLLVKGPSGSGKSTFLFNLLGVLEPTDGEVTINKEKLENLRARFLQSLGYVGPQNFLIRGTIRDNLLYGNPIPLLSDKDLDEAIKQARLKEVVDSLPQGLDTPLSENAELSTGQQQRLALARALLRRPQVLVLDEATSNLDLKTEKEFLEIVRDLNKQGLIIIAVSHRDTYAPYASKLLEMQSSDRPNELFAN